MKARKCSEREIIISAQIDDIFVSIKEQESYGASGAIITEPYERRIKTLKEGESITLEFELIKENVRDVVVALTYSGREDQKNIHLKQEDPYISVVSRRDATNRGIDGIWKSCSRMVQSMGETEETGTGTSAGYSEEATAQEINNVYVSIKDDTESIIGFPYEHTAFRHSKMDRRKLLDFELRRNVDSLIVSLKYLDQEIPYKIHLEEDTRPYLYPECEEVSYRQ